MGKTSASSDTAAEGAPADTLRSSREVRQREEKIEEDILYHLGQLRLLASPAAPSPGSHEPALASSLEGTAGSS